MEQPASFANSDTICFSDGKYVGLQDEVFCRKPKKNGVLTLVAGAQRIDVPFGNLYHAKRLEAIKRCIYREADEELLYQASEQT